MNKNQAMPSSQRELDPASQRELIRAVEVTRPIGDLLGWLISKNPQADRAWIFAALKAIYSAHFDIAPATQTPNTYQIGSEEITACPQRVA